MWSLILKRPLFAIVLAIFSVIASNYMGYPLIDIFQSHDCDRNRKPDNEVYQGPKSEGDESESETRYERQELEALKRHQTWERYYYGDSDNLRRHQHQEWNELRQRSQQERDKWGDYPQFKHRDDYQNGRLYRGDN